MKNAFLGAGVVALVAGTAMAGEYAQIKGTNMKLHLGDVSSSVFRNFPPNFQGPDLNDLANILLADGIDCNNKITVMYATVTLGIVSGGPQSNALITIADFNHLIANPPTQNQTINMDTSVTHVFGGPADDYINDQGHDLSDPFAGGFGTEIAGDFTWDNVNRGDGHAWVEMKKDDRARYDWSDTTAGYGGGDPSVFQFVSWNGSNWEVVALDVSGANYYGAGLGVDRLIDQGGGKQSGNYVLDVVVPLPGAGGMGLAGLLGLATLRRRRAM